jgi:ABC-type molybdenum transport system ATPase subunit/photorepair protein PhrA
MKNNRYTYMNSISWQLEPTENYVYILNNEIGKYYLLENVGKEIWLCIDKKYSFDEIVNKLSSIFNIDKNILVNDTKDLLNNLLSENLITNLIS